MRGAAGEPINRGTPVRRRRHAARQRPATGGVLEQYAEDDGQAQPSRHGHIVRRSRLRVRNADYGAATAWGSSRIVPLRSMSTLGWCSSLLKPASTLATPPWKSPAHRYHGASDQLAGPIRESQLPFRQLPVRHQRASFVEVPGRGELRRNRELPGAVDVTPQLALPHRRQAFGEPPRLVELDAQDRLPFPIQVAPNPP